MLDAYPQLPRGKDNTTKQNLPPPIISKQLAAYAAPSASSVVTFGADTTEIEITALNASLAIKWGPNSVIATAGATANFDHIIPVNQTRRFAIPVSVIGQGMSVMGANALNGLYTNMAVISTASTLTAINEF